MFKSGPGLTKGVKYGTMATVSMCCSLHHKASTDLSSVTHTAQLTAQIKPNQKFKTKSAFTGGAYGRMAFMLKTLSSYNIEIIIIIIIIILLLLLLLLLLIIIIIIIILIIIIIIFIKSNSKGRKTLTTYWILSLRYVVLLIL